MLSPRWRKVLGDLWSNKTRTILVVLSIAVSWLIAFALALPFSMLLSSAVGQAFLRGAISFTFSLSGAVLWLGVVIALAALASFLPARNASRVAVRDVLAYE